MNWKQRVASFALSAAMLVAPAAMAEESYAYPAGKMTSTVINEAYVGGYQLNADVDLAMQVAESIDSSRLNALAELVNQSTLSLSFYDDFGTARVRAALTTDGVTLLTADMLCLADGSMQVMTSLTGKYVFVLPAGALSGFSLEGMLYGGGAQADTNVDFNSLPAFDRLRITSSDVGVMIFNHLLGWVSYAQIQTGELYVFDDTPIAATDTRDAVAQRMIGTIRADEFNTLFWNIVTTICDEKGAFQQALADSLAELGVTRYQARQFTDRLMTEETIDPAEDWVQPSHAIADDGALCQYDDVSYFFKKLQKCADKVWEESTDNTLSMIVSYDEEGKTVGFDAELPKYSENLPYEGALRYSSKTGEDDAARKLAHGELTVYGGNHIIGDLDMQAHNPAENVRETSFAAVLDLQNDQPYSLGVGIDAGMTSQTAMAEGAQTEQFTGALRLNAREDGASQTMAQVETTGQTTYDGTAFALTANVQASLLDQLYVGGAVTLAQAEYDGVEFTGGQAVAMDSLDEQTIDQVKNEVAKQAAKLSMGLVLHPGVLSNLLKLVSE